MRLRERRLRLSPKQGLPPSAAKRFAIYDAAPMRQVEQFLISSKMVVDECKVGGVEAPCDCASGACD